MKNQTFKFALLTQLTAIGVVAASTLDANAGWDNVFQVACRDCDKSPSTSYYAAPAPTTTSTSVRYEERAYYETRTSMVPERYQAEVPVQVKSYYYDPVTTYTRSSYRDPCTNECKDVCVPKTCYVRKEQCNTVMKAVERIRMVPTEVRRKVVERRPVYTQTYYGPATRSYENDCDLPSTTPAASYRRISWYGPATTARRDDRADLPTNKASIEPSAGFVTDSPTAECL